MSEHRTRLHLVRHGETEWHADNRYAGAESDIDLTELGRAQARSLAAWAERRTFSALVVSPVRRARETAAPVERATGLDAQVEPELREVGFGVAEGRTVAELVADDPAMVDRFRDDPDRHPFPGAERPADAARRAGDRLRALAREHRGGDVLVIAHNTVLRLALCELLGLPVGDYRRLFPRLENAAVSEVRLDTDVGTAALLRLNAPTHADVPPAPPSDPTPAPPARPRHTTEEKS